MQSQKKTFGTDQQLGVHEQLAEWKYGPRYKEWLDAGILVKRNVGGQVFVSHREVLAGEERSQTIGTTATRTKKLDAFTWEEAGNIMKALGWYYVEAPLAEKKRWRVEGCVREDPRSIVRT